MRARYYCYIEIDEQQHCVYSSGIEFKLFMEHIPQKPKNILLLESEFNDRKYNKSTHLYYADSSNMNDLVTDNVYDYGNFRWVDFENQQSLDELSKLDLAKLLYFSHRCEPFDSICFPTLQNNYLYAAHDDDWWTRVFMLRLEEYLSVLEGKILKEFKGRKRSIKPIPKEIVETLYSIALSGMVIDFEHICFFDGGTCVRIYKIGHQDSFDEIHARLDEKRNHWFGNLEYLNRSKKWTFRENKSQ